MLKEIFEKMDGREWEYAGEYQFKDDKVTILLDEPLKWNVIKLSLADLLADKSWCLAVWGEREPLTTNDDAPWGSAQKCLHCGVDPAYQPPVEIDCNHAHYPEACTICDQKTLSYKDHSSEAFKIRQESGREKALEYILKTMKK